MKAINYVYGSVGHTLKKLPMSARMKATRNFTKTNKSRTIFKHYGSSLSSLFRYDTTPEGAEYWQKMNSKYFIHNKNEKTNQFKAC